MSKLFTSCLVLALFSAAFLSADGARAENAADEPGKAPVSISFPVRMTTHPAEDYMPAVSPDGALLAFVSNRSGAPNIWIKTMGRPEIPAPQRLTGHASGDKNPRFSPDGKSLAYVSYGSDAEGDIYLIRLPKLKDMPGFRPSPERLTDISTADKEPVFTPDGAAVIFTSAEKGGASENIWMLNLKTRERKQLTKNGGSSPAMSPGGRHIVFVSKQDGRRQGLRILEIAAGAESELTDGEWIDMFPSFIDGRRIVFVRYAADTNRDGKITIDDNPSLFMMDTSRTGSPPVPLTAPDSYSLFPSSGGGYIYYSAKTGAAVDVFRLPVSGMAPPLGSLAADMKRAEDIEMFYPGRPYLAFLAWSEAWAANQDDRDENALARCLMEAASVQRETGQGALADRTLALLIKSYPRSRPWAGLASVERILIAEELSGLEPDEVIKRLAVAESSYSGSRPVAARARMETAAAHLKAGRPDEALKILRGVVADFSDSRDLAAEAAFRRNEIYLFTGEREKLINVYLDVILSYPDQAEWADRAIGKILDIATVEGDLKASVAGLDAVMEKNPALPRLQAEAMNRIASLYYRDNELARARDSYNLTVTRFSKERGAVNDALFQIARIYSEQEDYARALAVYRSIEQDTERKRDVYLKSRREYIRQSLVKGEYELRQGEARVALKTFKSVIEYDPSVTEAHRGLVRTRASLGEARRTAEDYEAELKKQPGDDVLLYSLGLSLTYLSPPDIGRAENLIKSAITKRENNPWYHQTLGWVYEQKARSDDARLYGALSLQEYQYALALTDADAGAERQADLLLNIGNANFLLGSFADARESYRARLASGVPFADRGAESLFHQRLGVCEYRLGDDEEAGRRFEKALELAGDNEGARKIELLDRIGLVRQSEGKWEDAAKSFMESLRLRRETGAAGDEAVVTRNIANNLFFLSRSRGHEAPETLREALAYYKKSEEALKSPVKKKEKKSKALISVEVETGAGGVKGSSEGFSEQDERKLVFHHIGRIYGELGDYKKAAGYFEEKLAMTPSGLPLLENVPVLTEKAIVLNQLGYYLAKSGDTAGAFGRFSESLDLCRKLESATGILFNAGNMARLLLEERGALTDEDENGFLERGLAALDLAVEKKPSGEKLLASSLNHLGLLFHRRFVTRISAPPPADPASYAAYMKGAAADSMTAGRLYRKAEELFPPEEAVYVAINAAKLFHDEGREDEAERKLGEAETTAAGRFMDDAMWRIKHVRYTFDPARHAGAVREAALALEKTPFGAAVENSRLAQATVRSIYDALAERAWKTGDAQGAFEALEMGRRQAVKLSLGGLTGSGVDDKAVPGLGVLRNMFDRWNNLRGAAGNKQEAQRLEEERAEYIGKLRVKNPLLAEMASPDKFDAEKIRKSLDDREAAVTLWRRGDGKTLAFIVARQGFDAVSADDEAGIIHSLSGAAPMTNISRVYLVTDRPFSDPAAVELAARFSVASVPSFTSIPYFKERRSVNDYRLLVIGDKSPAAGDASSAYLRYDSIAGEAAEKPASDDLLRSAGVAVFTRAPSPYAGDPLKTFFDAGGAPDETRKITVEKLINLTPSGAALVTPPVTGKDGREWEGALLTLSLLAGYPVWVTAPEDAAMREVFLKEFLPGLRKDDFDKAFAAARSAAGDQNAALAGAFAFTGAEKAAYAQQRFADRIREGVAAINESRWGDASVCLEQALVYANAAGIGKYDELLLDRLAEVEFKRGEYAAALGYQQRLNGMRRASGDKVKLADSLLLTGVIQTRMSMYEKAVENMSAAMDIYREKGLMEMMAAASSKLGVAEENFARYGKALDAFGLSLETRREMGDETNSAQELRRIGRIYHLRLNLFGKARAAYKEALSLYRKLGDDGAATLTMIELGAVEEDAGALGEAEKIFREALDAAEKRKDEKAAALAEFHLANVHWFRGEYEPAYSWARRSIKRAEQAGDKAQMTISLNTLGLIGWTLNDYRRALDNLEKSLSLARETGVKLDEASALNNIGLIHRSMGDVARSIDYFTRARVLDTELGSKWGIAYDARNLSISHLLAGDLKDARTLAEEADTLSTEIGDRVNASKARLQLAEVLAAEKSWDEALEAFRMAKELAESTGVAEVTWRALRGEGRGLAAKGDRAGAIDAYRRAVDVVEKMRASLKIDELKSGFLDDKQDLYEELILLLLDAGKTQDAFAYAERSRARSFIDILGTSKIRLKDEQSQRDYENITSLKRRLEELTRAFVSGQAEEEISRERREVSEQLSAAIEKARVERPDVLQFVSVEPASAEKIMAALGPGAVLLEYTVTPGEVVIFAVTRDKIEAVRVPAKRDELAELVSRYRKLIQDRAPAGDEPARLGETLISPVMDRIKDAEIVGIAPHRALHYLSFAAVKAGGEYLIDEKPIFYTPSASVFVRAASFGPSSAEAGNRALAVGNPYLGDYNTDLPLAELEARSLKWVFPQVDVLLRDKATESSLVEKAGSYNVLHIASHGQFDPANPMRSSLFLTPDRENDGSLRVNEVFYMDLDADLVTLSACQTGLGEVTRGDDVVGLNRAFFYSGARSIVSTLWRVDDMASAILVKHFYRNLLREGKAQALRKAQLMVKKESPHVSFWAGFTLVGDYR